MSLLGSSPLNGSSDMSSKVDSFHLGGAFQDLLVKAEHCYMNVRYTSPPTVIVVSVYLPVSWYVLPSLLLPLPINLKASLFIVILWVNSTFVIV